MPELLPVILETGLRVLLALSGLLLVLFTIMTAIRVFVLPRGDNARLARLIFRLRPSSISQSTNRGRIRRGINIACNPVCPQVYLPKLFSIT